MASISSDAKWMVRRFAPFARPYVACLGCAILYGVLTILDPLIIRWLIDDVILNEQAHLLALVAVALTLNHGGRILFDRLGVILSAAIEEKMMFRTRLAILRRLQRLSARYHEGQQVGDMLYRFQGDVEQIAQIGGSIVPAIFRIFTVALLTLGAMCLLSLRLTLVVLVLTPCLVFLHSSFKDRLRDSAEVARQKAGAMSAFLQDHLSAIIQVKLLSREVTEARKFANLAANNARAQMARQKIQLAFLSVTPLATIGGVSIMLAYGGHLVIAGALSVGSLVAFYGYALQLFGPLYSLVDLYSRFQQLGASIRRIVEIENAPVEITDRPGAVILPSTARGAVKVTGVHFGYRPDKPVLRGVDFQLWPGEKTAVMGVSGSGKSTIAHLIARLADVQDGAILVDSHDIRSIKLASLRSTVALVPQDPVLFNCTLRENLIMGNPKASTAQLEAVVEMAQLRSVIERLPEGWEESVGPRGSRLSGGERQRVALARAILQRPRVLILDEFTSAVDTVTESALLEALDEFAQGRTLLVISHRLAALTWADRVLLLSDGRIVQEARPDDFHARGSFLNRLRETQVTSQILDQPGAVLDVAGGSR